MGFTLYLLRFTPLESPAACSGDEDVIPFTCWLMLMGEWEMQNPNTKGLMIWTLIFGV